MADFAVSQKRLNSQNALLKRKRNLCTSDQETKLRKNSGKAYIGRNGNFNLPKVYSQEVLCGPRCTKEGCRINEDRRIDIFTQFWDIGHFNEQSGILTRFFRKEAREGNYKYYLPDIDGIQQQVCKTTFLACFGISPKRLQVLQTKLSSRNISVADKRGRHENRPRKLGEEVKEAITSHINSYERTIGHYSRKEGDPERAYLRMDLNVSMMFKDFAAAFGEEALSWEWIYRSIFRSMKLKIGIPRTDTCTNCDRYHNKIQSLDERNVNDALQLEELWTNWIDHQLQSENGYLELQSDVKKSKEDASFVTICVDLQGVLSCPRLSNSEFYYQRKYSCFNLAIYEGASDKTSMCFWDQREASRGSSEIASCLYKFCLDSFPVLQNGEKKTLTVYSDRCVGQNNNYMLIVMYRLLIEKRYFTEVNQKFMVTGHSFLPCDRQFALIEKKQKTASIYEPQDWINIIAESNLANPFTIQRMTQVEFLDFKHLALQIRRPNTLKVTESLWFQLSTEFVQEIRSKEFLSDVNWTSHRWNVPQEFQNIVINPLYQMPLILSQGLITDLKRMQDFLPTEAKVFWQFLNQL